MRKHPAPVFPSAPLRKKLTDSRTKSPEFWEKKGEKMALGLLDFARTHVPAYKNFLDAHGVNLNDPIHTIEEFKKIPTISKDSYLRAYPYQDLFAPLALHRSTTVSATSGSTGEPFFFPRSSEHDAFYERSMRVLLSGQWDVGKRSTLCLVGFGLGI